MTFRVGQKGVCINSPNTAVFALVPEAAVFKGEIFIVRAVGLNVVGLPGIKLVGRYYTSMPGFVGVHTQKPCVDLFYKASNFRSIVERKTDISVFTKMLNTQKADARA